ncbi:tRNA-iA37 methylthiotransferase [Salmonella enterica subsp. enterica serovar Alachua str. R6-377]|uniref:tRNA-iA37 methylthiotransferase n=1 Tax=Salmonella enterica subsp. enterica serovar Alachua str. R6-377 TaxID=913241 RepID=G5LKU5_SALET|nr:tRNA-iA37 methylthiotransferase [Salmonella enterica subsp. enterica serovar Alachua str. R6-377]
MADLLDATHGYQLTDVAEEADVLLLNTCSIREKAQEKVFHQLGRWRLLKEKNPDLIIGVGGCVASQEGEHIRQRAHYVDIIFAGRAHYVDIIFRHYFWPANLTPPTGDD